jgi:hypothetical protein
MGICGQREDRGPGSQWHQRECPPCKRDPEWGLRQEDLLLTPRGGGEGENNETSGDAEQVHARRIGLEANSGIVAVGRAWRARERSLSANHTGCSRGTMP